MYSIVLLLGTYLVELQWGDPEVPFVPDMEDFYWTLA